MQMRFVRELTNVRCQASILQTKLSHLERESSVYRLGEACLSTNVVVMSAPPEVWSLVGLSSTSLADMADGTLLGVPGENEHTFIGSLVRFI